LRPISYYQPHILQHYNTLNGRQAEIGKNFLRNINHVC